MKQIDKEGRYRIICSTGIFISLFMAAVSLLYKWPVICNLIFTFSFALFLIVAVYRYVSVKGQSRYEKLRAEKEQIERESAHKSEYYANMTHEIRTPINAIMGYNELILREYNDPALRQYANNIRSAANSLLSIVNDSLDYSRMEAGKMVLLPAQYDLGKMIEDLVTMTRPRALAKGLDLRCLVNKDIPGVLYGDVDRLKQCIINLLTNAVKYTQDGRIDFSVDYEPVVTSINSMEKEIMLKISVKDTGIGIKEEDLARLYSPFERIDEEKNRSVEGSGLGISIVKRILGIMDSKLEVESVYGEGSDFHFEVRQGVISVEPVGDFEQRYVKKVVDQRVNNSRFIAPRARVLVVDDAEMNLSVIEGLLKNTRIQVDSALSARTGLELAGVNDYDLIFIDMKMPGISGAEMVERLKRSDEKKDSGREFGLRRLQKQNESEKDEFFEVKNEDTPCIALTAESHKEVHSQYSEQRFSDYLFKPIVYKELESILLRYLPQDKIEKADHRREEVPLLMTEKKLNEAVEILNSRSRK